MEQPKKTFEKEPIEDEDFEYTLPKGVEVEPVTNDIK